MRVVQSLDEETWRGFVEANPRGNIFHTPEMFRVFANTHGHEPMLWAVLGDQGKVLALFSPVQVTVLRGVLRDLTTRAVAYGSVLCAPGPEGQEALAVLLRAYNQGTNGRVLFTELRNLSDLSDVKPALEKCGFIHEDHLNFCIDLTRSHSELWLGIRSNARRNIQKAIKSGVVVEDVSDQAGVSVAHAMLERVYNRIQVPLPNKSLFLSAFYFLYPKEYLRIFLAKVSGECIGALILLLYKGVVHYWYTGTLREYSQYRAGDLLVWHALEFGQKNGFNTFDFGGAGRVDEEYGVRDFKAKFGGKLVNYGRNTCVHRPMRLKLSQTGYQLTRRFLF